MENKPLPRPVRAIIAHLFHLPMIILVALATQTLAIEAGVWWTAGILGMIWIGIIFIAVKNPKYVVLLTTHSNTALAMSLAWALASSLTSSLPSQVFPQAIVLWYIVYVWKCYTYKQP